MRTLAALAYTLTIHLRRYALVVSELSNAGTATIRVLPLEIAAAVVRNTRRVRILLASSHPMRAVFLATTRALAPQVLSSAVPGTLTNDQRQGGLRLERRDASIQSSLRLVDSPQTRSRQPPSHGTFVKDPA